MSDSYLLFAVPAVATPELSDKMIERFRDLKRVEIDRDEEQVDCLWPTDIGDE